MGIKYVHIFLLFERDGSALLFNSSGVFRYEMYGYTQRDKALFDFVDNYTLAINRSNKFNSFTC